MKDTRMSRVYKIQKIGRAYYLCIPKVLVRDKMLEQGVNIEVHHVSDDNIILELKTAGVIKEYIKDNQESGKNTSELGTTSDI